MIWIFGFIVLKVVVKKRKRLRNTCFCVGAEKLENSIGWNLVLRLSVSNKQHQNNVERCCFVTYNRLLMVENLLSIDIFLT